MVFSEQFCYCDGLYKTEQKVPCSLWIDFEFLGLGKAEIALHVSSEYRAICEIARFRNLFGVRKPFL